MWDQVGSPLTQALPTLEVQGNIYSVLDFVEHCIRMLGYSVIADKPIISEVKDIKALFPAHAKSPSDICFPSILTSWHCHKYLCPGKGRWERLAAAIKYFSLEVTHVIYTHISLSIFT